MVMRLAELAKEIIVDNQITTAHNINKLWRHYRIFEIIAKEDGHFGKLCSLEYKGKTIEYLDTPRAVYPPTFYKLPRSTWVHLLEFAGKPICQLDIRDNGLKIRGMPKIAVDKNIPNSLTIRRSLRFTRLANKLIELRSSHKHLSRV